VYHLTINFDPADPVTPERMQAVADRVLADLGLAEHQALPVAHRDRTHPHTHIMVTRVHPETGPAWACVRQLVHDGLRSTGPVTATTSRAGAAN
jgi:hypothetical protein